METARYGTLLLYTQDPNKLLSLLPGMGSQSFNFFSCVETLRGSVDCLPGHLYFYPGNKSSLGLRQYRQRAESCMGLLLPSGQKSAITKMFRWFTSVRRYSTELAMTIANSRGKFNRLGSACAGIWDNLNANDSVTGILILIIPHFTGHYSAQFLGS